jgi:hypothetical protein
MVFLAMVLAMALAEATETHQRTPYAAVCNRKGYKSLPQYVQVFSEPPFFQTCHSALCLVLRTSILSCCHCEVVLDFLGLLMSA